MNTGTCYGVAVAEGGKPHFLPGEGSDTGKPPGPDNDDGVDPRGQEEAAAAVDSLEMDLKI